MATRIQWRGRDLDVEAQLIDRDSGFQILAMSECGRDLTAGDEAWAPDAIAEINDILVAEEEGLADRYDWMGYRGD